MTQVIDRIGVATGRAWIHTGVEIVFVETTNVRGSNQLTITGSLEAVMKASAQAAMSYLSSHGDAFTVPESFFEQPDLYIHMPAGAIPKGGTSAGAPIEELSQGIDQVLKADL